jgi:hypothetical protein
LEDMFSRVSAEGQIHSNLTSVITKLNTEGTLDKLYTNFKNIFENEVNYTLNGKPPVTVSSQLLEGKTQERARGL